MKIFMLSVVYIVAVFLMAYPAVLATLAPFLAHPVVTTVAAVIGG